MAKTLTRFCAYCDEPITRGLFCSRGCYGNWKRDFNAHYRKGDKYDNGFDAEFRQAIRKRDNCTCAKCGVVGGEDACESYLQGLPYLAVHHIDHDKGNSTPENCIILCYRCHGLVHNNPEEWQPKLAELAQSRSEALDFTPSVKSKSRQKRVNVMATNGLPRIEGTGARVIVGTDSQGRQRKRPNAADLQAAINHAGETYRVRFGRAPSHVALPTNNTIALDALRLWTLNLARPSGPGVVICGRPIGDNGTGPTEATQLELL